MTTNPHIGSSFNDFLEGQGTRDETIIAPPNACWLSSSRRPAREHLTAAGMAERMGSTEGEVGRHLDPADDTVQLGTVRRAADAVGRKVWLDLT